LSEEKTQTTIVFLENRKAGCKNRGDDRG